MTGNHGAVTWGIEGTDTTCERVKHHGVECSNIESLTPTTAAFQAGPQDGSVTVVAVDTLGEEATVLVTVAGTADDAGTLPTVDDAGPTGGPANPPVPAWDGGEPTTDAGTWGSFDAAAPPEEGADDQPRLRRRRDLGLRRIGRRASVAPAPDGGSEEDGGATAPGSGGGGSSGCSCVVAGSERAPGESSGAAFGGLLLGMALIGRRRTAKRVRRA